MPSQLESKPNAVNSSSHPGCYSLIIELKRKKTIRVGKLGEAVFPAGTYIYTGSAMKGLGARLRRHCDRKKKRTGILTICSRCQTLKSEKLFSIPPRPVRSVAKTNGSLQAPGAVVILKNFGAVRLQVRLPKPSAIFRERFLAGTSRVVMKAAALL